MNGLSRKDSKEPNIDISPLDLGISILSAVVASTCVALFIYMVLVSTLPTGNRIWPFLVVGWAVVFVPAMWIYYRSAKEDAEMRARFPGHLLNLVGRFGSQAETEIEGFEHRVNFVAESGGAQISRVESIGSRGSSTTQLRVTFEAASEKRLWVEKREIAANLFNILKGRPKDLLQFSDSRLGDEFLLFGNGSVGADLLSDPIVAEISRLSAIDGLHGLRVYLDGECFHLNTSFASRRRPGVVDPLSLRYLEQMLISGQRMVSALHNNGGVDL